MLVVVVVVVAMILGTVEVNALFMAAVASLDGALVVVVAVAALRCPKSAQMLRNLRSCRLLEASADTEHKILDKIVLDRELFCLFFSLPLRRRTSRRRSQDRHYHCTSLGKAHGSVILKYDHR